MQREGSCDSFRFDFFLRINNEVKMKTKFATRKMNRGADDSPSSGAFTLKCKHSRQIQRKFFTKMVLLPDPSKYNAKPLPNLSEKRTIFFANEELDKMARHFVGNNNR